MRHSNGLQHFTLQIFLHKLRLFSCERDSKFTEFLRMFLWLVKETLMAKFMGSCVMLKC